MKTCRTCLAAMALGGLLLLSAISTASANVVIAGTRVVYPANEREITVKLDNAGNEPALVQAWVDSGNAGSRADQADAPFLLMPPVARISPQRSQTLRMTYTRDSLPQNVESVFWLNVLDVPPLPKSADNNFVQVAFRSRIKVFFRPEGLKGYPEDTPSAVTWKLVQNGEGFALRGTNPTVFSASYNKTELLIGGKTYSSKGGMIPARGVFDFPLEGLLARPQADATVRYEWINDYGSAKSVEAKLGS
ncbi:fimbria/pilus periplasmic chaperone [Pseudomonas soli]|uniref:Molecular chaperone EcpD n=1 Tax=Pseudomonas soli TaxID=1306993 RepID=A0A2V4I217_9PSED|nr:fimbria/pilus periplasmic chaperone [Pseudomonas soli]PYB80643.1 molecular chaperone EcpD [Pseudomonas soli]